MKNIVKNNVVENIQRCKYNILLTLIICILFLCLGYSSGKENYKLYINDSKVDLHYRIFTKNNEQYIHIDDLTRLFEDNIYYDKISAKLILTTYNKLVKINIADKDYVIKDNDDRYCNLTKFVNEIGYNIIVFNDNIYITSWEFIQGEVQYNRTELYSKNGKTIICYLNKGSKVKVYLTANGENEISDMLSVEANIGSTAYYGKVLKKNIEYIFENSDEQNEPRKVVMVKADEKLLSSTDTQNVDMVAINMYRLSGVNSLTKLDYTNDVPNSIEVLATINNGSKLSNYDQDIVTGMLNSEQNRYEVVQQITQYAKNIAGVNLDFSNLKVSDKQNYTQFIKELGAVLHSNGKKLIVNVSSTKYVDVEKIISTTDYIVLQAYNERTSASKTSGPIASLNYVEKIIQDIVQKGINLDKVILELPAYSILWTERKGTVINAEQYTMHTVKEYLRQNNIEYKLDKTSGQNYINHTKGITTYKMWLEDEYSALEKTKLAKKYDLAGVAIYKSGMELKSIYKSINKILDE